MLLTYLKLAPVSKLDCKFVDVDLPTYIYAGRICRQNVMDDAYRLDASGRYTSSCIVCVAACTVDYRVC